MYRIERSPVLPMLSRTVTDRSTAAREAIVCAGVTIPESALLLLVPNRRVTVEPDAACAIARCLEGNVSRLLIDLAPLGPAAMSALAQLRLMRPELSIVVLVGDEEPDRLEGTLLHDAPMLQVPRILVPPMP